MGNTVKKILRVAALTLGVVYGLRLHASWVRALISEPVAAQPTVLDVELRSTSLNRSHGYVPALHVVRD